MHYEMCIQSLMAQVHDLRAHNLELQRSQQEVSQAVAFTAGTSQSYGDRMTQILSTLSKFDAVVQRYQQDSRAVAASVVDHLKKSNSNTAKCFSAVETLATCYAAVASRIDAWDHCVMVSSRSSAASARVAMAVAIALQSVNTSEACIEMPVAVNEVLYDTSISLNRVFVFEFVKCVRIVSPPKDPAQKRFVVFWDFRETRQLPSQTTTSGSQLGGGEINIVDLCVTIFDAVFDFNLKWSDLSTKQLGCTLSEIACFDPTHCCITSFRVR